LGTGRCGSTLLQKILNSVDNAMIYGEHGGFLIQIAAAYFLNLEDKMIEKYIMSQNVAGKEPISVFETLKNPLDELVQSRNSKKQFSRFHRVFFQSYFSRAKGALGI